MEPLPYLQEVEMIHLSRDIPHTSYSKLCDAMGYSYNLNQSILASHRGNYNEAVTEILIKWNTEQADTSQSRSILATKLHAMNLGGLGKKLSKGEYLPKQQDPYEQEETPLQSSSDIYSEKISESLTVLRCREKLENKYRNQLCKVQIKPWDPSDYVEFKDLHTVVTVVKKDAHGKDTKKKEILKGSVAGIFSTKVNGRLPARILVSAPAGRGKTTAVAKMAYDWVHREKGSALEHLPLLFVLKFSNTNQLTSIGEAIKSQLLSDVHDLTPEGLESFIRKNQGICHIILDGLDEYAGISSSNQSLGSNIVSVIRWEEFPECRVLVTTRPHLENFFDQAELPRVYTKMWIEGFSQESSREYIDKFFVLDFNPYSEQAGHDLKVYLDDQPLINDLVKTPLFCLMVCQLWSNGRLDARTTTQTDLLDSVNDFLMHHANARSGSRVNITTKKLRTIISQLGEVALTGLLDDAKKLVFTPHDFRKVPAILDIVCELGIVSKITFSSARLPLSFKTNPMNTSIEFYHKLAQEHSAGKFLADQTNSFQLRLKISKLDIVLRKIKSNIGDYENLIRFAAGTHSNICVRIMEVLLANSCLDDSERYRILLDCSSETRDNEGNVSSLVQRCVTAQSIALKSPTVYTVVGMQNLPQELKHKVKTVKFEASTLTPDVTSGLWSCLKAFTMLHTLIISDSSFSFPSSPPELPSVTKLSAERVTSRSYEGLLPSLPGLRDIDVIIDDAERDIPQITACLRRTGGQQLVHIKLIAPPSLPSGKNCVSGETMRGLDSLIREQIKNLQWLGLSGMKSLDEEDFVELVESSTSLKALDSLHLKSIDYESFKYDRQSNVQCLYFTRRDHEKILEGFARRTDEVLPSTTETSPERTLFSSQGPSAASTSVDIHFQDASVAAGEVSTSKARVPSIEEQHEDEGTAETSPETTLSSSQRPSAASTSVDIPPQDASVAAAEVSTSKARVPSIEEQHEDEEIDPEEAIRNGMAPWNRSRIMVIGPAGVGKTSLIRRLTGQKFNPEEKSTKGAEQNVVTQSAVSRWALVNDDQTAKGDLIQSIATMDPNFRSNISSSTGEEENRSDPAITAKGDLIQSIATMEDPTFGGSISSSTGRGENRSDPAVTAKDDLIQSIATMEDPNFGSSISSSTGGEENRSDPAITGKDDLIQSIATMEDPNFGGSISCSPGGEENRRDPAITERRGVELETDQDTTLELPSTSSQQPMIQENEISTREHRQIAESDTGHVEEPIESKMKIQNRGSKLSTPGAGDMSEATKYERDVIVSPTINNEKIAKLSQGITREEITKVKSSALDITYSMWDFGGQEIYYITHPLFLSWRSLYILVIPLHLQLSDRAPREEDAQDTLKQLKGSTVRTQRTILELIHFWLMSVYTHAVPDSNLQSTYEPKVLLIGTFSGDEGLRINEEKVTAKFKELKDRLGSNPYWKQVLSPMCWIDNQFSIESEVNKIQDCIDGLIKDSAYMEVQMPIKWRTFSTEIADSDQNTLTVTEAHSIMTNWGMNDLEEVKAVLKFYHDIGHLIYHQGCELIVLKPQFLNSIVSNIITVIDDKKMDGDLIKCWTDLKEKGILHIKLIQAVWEEHKGDHGQLDNIIDLMIKFDLICKIPDGPREEKRFFVPCRSSPELHKREILDKDDKVEFTIDFYHFLPDGFLHRFYVRMAQWSMERMESIKPTFHCREMVFYIDNGHRVVMTNDIHEDCEIKIMIYTVVPYGAPSGREPATVNMNTDIIDFLHATLNDLKELWARRIEYRVGIWCPRYAECGCKGWIHIRDILKSQDKTACCDEGCAIYVGGILEAFSKGTTETSLGGASAAAGEVTTSTTRPTEESREQDFDDLLKTVAKKIHRDIDIDNLGKELGFEPAEITRYIQTNEKYRTVTYMGTLSMLRDWRNKTTRSKERQQMRKALIAIGHNHLADDLLNDDLAN